MSSAKDFTGQTINNLTLLKRKRENKRTYYYCQCKLCGNKKWIRDDTIKGSQSCGCLSKTTQFTSRDITNQKFGRLIALEPTEERNKYNGGVIWKCKCACGNICYVSSGELIKHTIQSCGCLREELKQAIGNKAGTNSAKVNCAFNTNIPVIRDTKPRKNNTSGCTGVTWHKDKQRWLSIITFQKKIYRLGSFREEDKDKAIEVRKEAEQKLFGEFLKWYEEHKNENSR